MSYADPPSTVHQQITPQLLPDTQYCSKADWPVDSGPSCVGDRSWSACRGSRDLAGRVAGSMALGVLRDRICCRDCSSLLPRLGGGVVRVVGRGCSRSRSRSPEREGVDYIVGLGEGLGSRAVVDYSQMEAGCLPFQAVLEARLSYCPLPMASWQMVAYSRTSYQVVLVVHQEVFLALAVPPVLFVFVSVLRGALPLLLRLVPSLSCSFGVRGSDSLLLRARGHQG